MDSDRPSSPPGPAFDALVALIARLRAPGGCPWDREQTHASLKPMLIEEAYEVLEAVDEGDDAELAGELGDLLLQVVFHAQIAAEEKRFTVADVI
ncbi:MAG TPA: MazG nucleotide pyrophosphohydrolase domain-containing protein, partial [Vicinamibacteria bacterium]